MKAGTKMESKFSATVVDEKRLREKLESDAIFISRALSRVPSTYWSVVNDDHLNGYDSEEGPDVEVPRRPGQMQKGQKKEKVKKAKGPGDKPRIHEPNLSNGHSKQTDGQSYKTASANALDKRPVKPVFNNEGKKVSSKFDLIEVNSVQHQEVKKPKKEKVKKTELMKESVARIPEPNTSKKDSYGEDFEEKPAILSDLQSYNSASPNALDQKPVKPVVNNKDRMVFNKFDLVEVDSVQRQDDKKLKKRKGPEEMLKKLIKQKQTIKRLKVTGKEKDAFELKSTEKWNNALKKAEGEKVMDNPELLLKTINRQKSQKKSSIQKWKTRKAGQAKSTEFNVKKREDNLNKRVEEKKKRKNKAISKTRFVKGITPGI